MQIGTISSARVRSMARRAVLRKQTLALFRIRRGNRRR